VVYKDGKYNLADYLLRCPMGRGGKEKDVQSGERAAVAVVTRAKASESGETVPSARESARQLDVTEEEAEVREERRQRERARTHDAERREGRGTQAAASAAEQRKERQPEAEEKEEEPTQLLSEDERLGARIRREQTQDEACTAAKKFLETKELPAEAARARKAKTIARECVVKDGVLISQWQHPRRDMTLDRLVVPLSLRQEVMRRMHEGTGGHLGVHVTYERLRERFFWPCMSSDVDWFVRSCRVCTERKAAAGPPRGLMMQRVRIGEPYYAVMMDCLKLPKTGKGHQSVLVVTCRATEEAWAVALKDERAETVARKVIKMMARTGCPQQVWSDKGANFTSKVMDVVARWAGADPKRTSSYHPQTNGQTERFNRTLCEMLSKYVQQNGADWDEWLPVVTMAYNSAVHASTGESPFFLNHGRTMRLPADVDMKLPEQYNPVEDFARDLVKHTRKALESAGQAQDLATQRQALYYDRERVEATFRPNDLVMLYRPSLASGLTHEFTRC